ncbi:VPLPA-CTERM sorting domain-containing protein [Roseospira navarrensis]|uniref:VPLPA-CTERM sorting domain-containing protein n=1 Tax=Roseospira navarrensis TaxID=140058 RepID=A0A7X2D6J3_9PROT|nr:VPLPA-CTERM sorting domain-containing protein [Roseospira navarrensis]MQX38320.1 VPLPA-CTERM sorting domain-containing protein [Roseospira navarrensis]
MHFRSLIGTATVAGTLIAAAGTAQAAGWFETDRLGYSGTVTRHDTLQNAKDGVNATDTVQVGPRDLSMYFSDGYTPDYNVAMGSWWYSTEGSSGWGNTHGNTGVGFMQMYDVGGASDTSMSMGFSDFDGTYYRDFSFSVVGGDLSDYSRLSVYDNVNDGGIFHEYAIDFTVSGLMGEEVSPGVIQSFGTHPTSVTGTMTGVFELTENETSPANIGFYSFAFDLNMENWAWENRDALDPNAFSESNFAVTPLPAAVWFLLTAIGGLVSTRWLKTGKAGASARA